MKKSIVMKKYVFVLFGVLVCSSSFAQKKTIKELKSYKNSKPKEEVVVDFFTNTANFTIYALSTDKELRQVEKTAAQFGIELKIREVIKSNKIHEIYFDIKNGEDTFIEHFENGNIALNKIDIEFYKNGNPNASPEEQKAKLIIKKDRNKKENGNVERILFSQ